MRGTIPPIRAPRQSRQGPDGRRPPPAGLALQRLVLRTGRGPLGRIWGLAYELILRLYAAWLTGTDRHASVYARGGLGVGDATYGLSDIDLTIVVPGAREGVLARRDRLCRRAPWLCEAILDAPQVFTAGELAAVGSAPVLTAGRAVYFGEHAHADAVRMRERPGLHGPTADWRLVSGPERRPPEPGRDRAELRVAAWLEIQSWWRWFLQACGQPEGPRSASLCFKAVAEPARVLLLLRHGERARSRTDALERALRLVPEEEPALRRALALGRALPSSPPPPTAEFLRHLVGLSARVADELAADVASAGTTQVLLDWSPRELTLAKNPAFRLAAAGVDPPDVTLLPLADWRALARVSLRWRHMTRPALPDETLAPLPGDPADLGDLTAAVAAGDEGPYPALRSGPLLVLASMRWPRTQLRAVHCPLTDPVSFALLHGQRTAAYPDVPGWSVADTARRAVAEHRAWLADPGELAQGGEGLAMAITAGRAALLHESLADRAPELALTASATLRRLGRSGSAPAALVDEAEDAYGRWRAGGGAPDERVVAAVRDAVGAMRAYRSRE